MAKVVGVWFNNAEWEEVEKFLEQYDTKASSFLRKLALSQIRRLYQAQMCETEKIKTIYD